MPVDLMVGVLGTVASAMVNDTETMQRRFEELEAEHGTGNVVSALYGVIGMLLGDVCRRSGRESGQVIDALAEAVRAGRL